MPLNNTLNTNEIKNSGGTEAEYARLSTIGRATEYKVITELPGYPQRLKVSHQESGSGVNRIRRSVVRFDDTGLGSIDTTKLQTISAYAVLTVPVGNLGSYNTVKDTLAKLMSFLASTGADTIIKYDCSGNGADALINGGL